MARPKKKAPKKSKKVVKKVTKKVAKKKLKKKLKKKFSKKYVRTEKQQNDVLMYIELINKIRRSRKKEQSDKAFEKIVTMLNTRINQIIYRINIPGYSKDDIYNEALFALRYKAIKDYDPERSNYEAISPFDKFAVLCIRRHLATVFKSSLQHKSKVLNLASSMHQDKSSDSDGELFLSNIIADKSTGDMLDQLDKREYYRGLFSGLAESLSGFEKKVFILYSQRFSYEEMANRLQDYLINDNAKKKPKKPKDIKRWSQMTEEEQEKVIKSVDNALSRIKIKANKIIEKYENDE